MLLPCEDIRDMLSELPWLGTLGRDFGGLDDVAVLVLGLLLFFLLRLVLEDTCGAMMAVFLLFLPRPVRWKDKLIGLSWLGLASRHESVRVLSLTCNGSCQTKG